MAIVTGFPKQFSGLFLSRLVLVFLHYLFFFLVLCNLFLFGAGLVCPRNYKLSFGTQRCNEVKFSDYGAVRLECRRVILLFACF